MCLTRDVTRDEVYAFFAACRAEVRISLLGSITYRPIGSHDWLLGGNISDWEYNGELARLVPSRPLNVSRETSASN